MKGWLIEHVDHHDGAPVEGCTFCPAERQPVGENRYNRLMTAWEVNPGLDPLLGELRAAHPGIVIGTIGDAAHRAEKSDHNPNAAGRVNAADLMIGPHFLEAAAGALLPYLVRDARTHYVIHNRKIWTTETRAWLTYGGTDPHTNHIHLSVIDAAYKNTKPWVISPPKPEDSRS